MNWNVICRDGKYIYVRSKDFNWIFKKVVVDNAGTHHALAEVIRVDAWQSPHEQGEHVSGPLRKALPTWH